jgi:signal transduction histidine kinase
MIEGEPAGRLVVSGSRQLLDILEPLLIQVVQAMLRANLKRMLTTEIHTKVVNQSWEELLETNQRLSISEARYKELAEHLELKVAERTAELKQAQVVLLEREKMAAIGQLAAGIAHEINNPMGFVTSNIATLKKYAARLLEMLDECRRKFMLSGQMTEDMTKRWENLKIDYIAGDLPELVRQTLEGAERVKGIVADLKGFSHVDTFGESEIILTDEIERTISVMKHQIPTDAVIIRNYSPLPLFHCQPGLFCQVFLNLIQNAIQAKPTGLKLVISVEATEQELRLAIGDNGPGIPQEISSRIFEPFYTTKPVGSGTGMGLAIAYDVIRQHGGTITAGPSLEGGALFTIRLPRVALTHDGEMTHV